MPAAPANILSLLRAGTARAHQDLEAQIDIERACRHEASYRRLLEAFWGFYEPLEARLRELPGWEEHGFRWTERSKVAMLERDLRALDSEEFPALRLPRCATLPRPGTLGAAFGCAYVLEGATLGGRQILAVLAASEIPPEARAFFTSYGESVGARWREFCEMLGRIPSSENESAVRAASDTFEALAAWLRKNL